MRTKGLVRVNVSTSIRMDLGLLRSLCARALQGGHVSSASGVVFNVERHAAEQILQLRFPKFTNASSTPPIQLNPNILRDFEPLLSSAPKSPDESVCECISILGAVESPLYPHSESVFVVVYLVSHLQALVQAHYASIAGGQKLELGKQSVCIAFENYLIIFSQIHIRLPIPEAHVSAFYCRVHDKIIRNAVES